MGHKVLYHVFSSLMSLVRDFVRHFENRHFTDQNTCHIIWLCTYK